ncbi:dTDP-glucose 4,6-dehydratase [Lacinutrix mariniflava]|uniref:dTDP-glucose 4,6-dehydratase n=1 Tax=Lacinutrix mariniflava TaxID=342955 RepID=UPI0006E2FD84|nr:dTDP-glucose 4,6-dehydratase [Lacinutrix mariniflava]
MKNKNILITGGAGFIGSNFIPYFLENNKDTHVVNLDKLTYAGDVTNLKEIEANTNYTFVEGDICDRLLIEELFNKYKFQGVIHFAAESHVDNSIKNPGAFVDTNITGTFNLLDVAKHFWMSGPNQIKKGFENARFHHISTDEVYGTLGEIGLFTENTPYAPNSPYSASKAASDFIVRSYFHTYGMNVVTTNCSNNYGPKQHNEKLIPTIIRKAISGEDIPIYGDGKNIRDWLYVLDHCKGIELAYKSGKSGETYNIGGRNERDNLSIVNTICNILDEVQPSKNSYKKQITFVKDRPGHDFRYAIDADKIESELSWKADENFESGIRKTIDWYLNKYNS